MYERFEHTADLGLRIRAADLPTLMVEAGRALFTVIAGDLKTIRPDRRVALRVSGVRPDELLVDWLAELLIQFEIEKMLFCDFDVTIDAHGLAAVGRGELLDLPRHRLEHEIKAITYHQLKVESSAEGWFAEVIVDI